jgi:UDP-N-acetylglucosamine--N-acetylmuramyl-(pentapeptide) pyrophosphoryl-undecaprenol N-acetylglucosamine transferase
MKGRGWKKGLAVLIMLPKSLFQSMGIIRDFKPSVVIGVGGYSAGPFCLVARLLGVPTAIHEQNSYPGLTNRLLARVVDRIFVSFAESVPYFKKSILTGNPVRRELLSPPKDSSHANDIFTVLVVGGSQGAQAVSEAFVKAYGILKKSGKSIDLIHQTGKQDHRRVLEGYRSIGFKGPEFERKVLPFIKDMASAYRQANIVVSRAGATTLFELAAMGKPSILIPYPYANQWASGNQCSGACPIGGAEMILQKDLTGEKLANTLSTYMAHPRQLKKMGQAAHTFSRPEADRIIVDQILTLTGRATS